MCFAVVFYDHILMSKIQTDEQFHDCFHVVFECFRRKQLYILSFQIRYSISNAELKLFMENLFEPLKKDDDIKQLLFDTRSISIL